MQEPTQSAGELLYTSFVNATRMRQPERRGSERRPWVSDITVNWHTGTETGGVKAVVHELSARGFGFFADRKVPEGTVVVAQFHGIPGRPRIHGFVRNTQQHGNLHRVGVEFR